jgi:hypothetical protein
MLSKNVFRGAREQHCFKIGVWRATLIQKGTAPGFDCCPRAARRRLYRQHRPKADISAAKG